MKRLLSARTLAVVSVNTTVFIVVLLLLEAAGQAVALIFPSYEVLFLQPDRVVGWKQVPSLDWTWAGHHWYAADFSVHVKTNSLGFRDRDREVEKPAGVTRIAVLGDSFIEAVQVPLSDTATQILERRLNAVPGASRYEVLNFGISNYGIGQYLLTWRQYARQFRPDYVAIFVARLHMWRTAQRYSDGAFPGTERQRLWIRPVFTLADGALTLEPARDYEAFCQVQADLSRSLFGGTRSRQRHQLITLNYGKVLAAEVRTRYGRKVPPGDADTKQLVDLNLAIIDELRKETSAAGARLAVIDVSRYLGDEPDVSTTLGSFCEHNDVTCIPASEKLMAAARAGQSTHWSHDSHLNGYGNAILADALHEWIQRELGRR